jgi:hypothetical protein
MAIEQDLALLDFLVRLSIEDDLRAQFTRDKVGTIDGLPDPLRDDSREAVLNEDHEAVFLRADNNQSTGGSRAPRNRSAAKS